MEERYEARFHIESRAGEEAFEQTADGTLYRKPSGWYLRYIELDDEGNETRTTVKLISDEWVVKRAGAVESEMRFVMNRPCEGYYRSGGIELKVSTVMRASRIAIEGGRGSLYWEYDLQIGDSPIERYAITYTFS